MYIANVCRRHCLILQHKDRCARWLSCFYKSMGFWRWYMKLGIVQCLDFSTARTRRGWGVCFTPRPLFTPGKDSVPIVQEAGWAPGPVWTGAENLASTGIRSPDCPARSQSQYQLNYLAHIILARRTERDMIIQARRFLCEVPVIVVGLWPNLSLLNRFSKNTQISNCRNICPVGAELFHEHGRTDKTDRKKPNSSFPQCCERA